MTISNRSKSSRRRVPMILSQIALPRIAYAERFVLTARTEITDRMLIFGQRHLRIVMAEYARHYSGRRPHRALRLHPPRPDYPAADLSQERVKRRPVLGGHLNEYERAGSEPRSRPPAQFWHPRGCQSGQYTMSSAAYGLRSS